MKYQHLRGLIIEGMSHSGKTSLLNAIKVLHGDKYERSLIVLGEHYSQVLHKQNGKLVRSNRIEHLEALKSRVKILSDLGNWGNDLGPASMQSRGIFYIFERFHLNHLHAFEESDISDIENELSKCNARTVLLTISPSYIEQRLLSREKYLEKDELHRKILEYEKGQDKFIEIAKESSLQTLIINTDNKNWTEYARDVLEFCGINKH